MLTECVWRTAYTIFTEQNTECLSASVPCRGAFHGLTWISDSNWLSQANFLVELYCSYLLKAEPKHYAPSAAKGTNKALTLHRLLKSDEQLPKIRFGAGTPRITNLIL